MYLNLVGKASLPSGVIFLVRRVGDVQSEREDVTEVVAERWMGATTR